MISASHRLALTLRRAPFCIFSKAAPSTLPDYNMDTDFKYFFFNDAMQRESGIAPSFLSPNRNAKTDFPPEDYPCYFRDDASVCMEFPFPKVKVITEPWVTPATTTIVETRKTSVRIANQLYMLGCFAPHDDIELGITKFKANWLPNALKPLEHVPAEWYEQAFDQLPMALHVLSTTNSGTSTTVDATVAENKLAAQEGFLDDATLEECLKAVHGAANDYDAFQVSDKLWHGKACRIWLWRLDDDTMAVAVRPKHEILPEPVKEGAPSLKSTI